MTSTVTQQCSSTEVTFSWESPEYSGHATIDNYTLTVDGNNYILQPHQISLTIPLHHQTTYQVHISATNCYSRSTPVYRIISLGEIILRIPTLHVYTTRLMLHMQHLAIIITLLYSGGCSSPPPLLRGTVSSSCTGVGSAVEYRCGPGLVLQGQGLMTCLEDGAWSPDPADFACKGMGIHL